MNLVKSAFLSLVFKTVFAAAIRKTPFAIAFAWIGFSIVRGYGGDFETAVAHYRDRRFGEAQPLFEKIAASAPTNAQVVFYLGALALRRGDFAESVKQLERATQLDPSSGHYQNELGDAYGVSAQKGGMLSKLGFAKKCLAAYERAVALEPDNLEYRLSVINYYVQAPGFAGGSMKKAYAIAEELRKRDPLVGGLTIAGLYGSEKKWPQAFDIVDALRKAYPERRELLYQIGRLAAISGHQLERGRDALDEYLKIPPAPGQPTPLQAQLRLGALHEKRGDTGSARAAYRAALEIDENSSTAREALERLKGN